MTYPLNYMLLISQHKEWPLTLYGHLTMNGFAPLTIVSTSEAALNLFYQTSPQLVLVDLHFSDGNIIDLCSAMLAAQPTVPVVLMADPEVEPPLTALYVGVAGCVNRNLPLVAWPGLLMCILHGGRVFSRRTVQTLLTAAQSLQDSGQR